MSSSQPIQQPEKETPYVLTDLEPSTKFTWENLARLRGPNALTAKEYIASRDGRMCWVCKILDDTLTLLEFHHLDRNERQNHRWNLRLVHHPCNTMVYHRDQKGLPVFTGQGRGRETAGPPSESLSESDTVKLNREYEELYRKFIIGRILAYGPDPDPADMEFLIQKNLHAGACEWTGCNPKTGYPYLARMTNPLNGFITEVPWRQTGRKILAFRKAEYYALQLEEIARRHPKEGLRMTMQPPG